MLSIQADAGVSLIIWTVPISGVRPVNLKACVETSVPLALSHFLTKLSPPEYHARLRSTNMMVNRNTPSKPFWEAT
ncbi:hypothetical protein PG993_004604 [Apiospora rasikravindrae]|uniref:Uncharacterized protein n=1 Tax=Apiospora rasikravindrae TaxID=990691 RepID=A0ABR1TD81_9PEZI